MHSLEEILAETRKGSKLCTAIERGGVICFNKSRVKNLCPKHYIRLCKHGSIDPFVKAPNKCKFIDCDNPYSGKGYCHKHYSKYIYQVNKKLKKCSVDNCSSHIHTAGMCAKHYVRLKKHGDINYVNRDYKKDIILPGRQRAQYNIKCIVPECDKDYINSIITKGLCTHHYYNWLKYGDYNHEKYSTRKQYLTKSDYRDNQT